MLKALNRWPADEETQKLTLTSLTSRVRDVLEKTKVLDHIASAFTRRSAALAEGRPVIVGRQLTADERSAPVIAQFPAPVHGAEGIPRSNGTAARPGTVATLDLQHTQHDGCSGAVLATKEAVLYLVRWRVLPHVFHNSGQQHSIPSQPASCMHVQGAVQTSATWQTQRVTD
jgi:hypothetical protein